ncbi:hypothetical protein IE81DRAFT_319746 [Ceraceosorus guamensis]|uniref:Zn(2)-C6 fungal-type domain-containing protein n=1 Tax=Ceraceosorus guamensis TaxID=1522189 RepID=A0A316WDI3_9BASI|nr:hypothetical protein IE81DRAFT_319746 [Ceraceosorus guamensis]PWN45903.1 hypothetical protein IE81DRAFT_319746 [Ceraceosorus guamensis]
MAMSSASDAASASQQRQRPRCDACFRAHKACDRAGPPCQNCAPLGRKCSYEGIKHSDKLATHVWAVQSSSEQLQACAPAGQPSPVPSQKARARPSQAVVDSLLPPLTPESTADSRPPRTSKRLAREMSSTTATVDSQPCYRRRLDSRNSRAKLMCPPTYSSDDEGSLQSRYGRPLSPANTGSHNPREIGAVQTSLAPSINENLEGIAHAHASSAQEAGAINEKEARTGRQIGAMQSGQPPEQRKPSPAQPPTGPTQSPSLARLGSSPTHFASPASLHEVKSAIEREQIPVRDTSPRWKDGIADSNSTISDFDLLLVNLLRSPLAGQLVDLYFDQVDPQSEMLVDTCIHDAVIKGSDNLMAVIPAPLQRTMAALILAMSAQVAQLCPTAVEVLLLTYGSIANLPVSKAEELERLTYTAAVQNLENIYSDSEATELPAEYFAASYCLRSYEKINGQKDLHIERLVIDTVRLQKAGLHRNPRSRKALAPYTSNAASAVANDLLEYRIFWLYLDKSRATSLISQTGYTIHNHAFNIDLRDDLQGAETQNGGLVNQAHLLGSTLPRLSRFAAFNARIGHYMGQCFDELLPLQQSASWQRDAETWSDHFQGKIKEMRESANAAFSSGALTPPQFNSIQSLLANVRAIVSRQLCEEFVTRLLADPRADSRISRWLALKTSLDASSSLIEMVMTPAASRAGQARFSTPILMQVLGLKFLKQQVVELFEVLTKIVKDECHLLGDHVTRTHLGDRARQALRGFSYLLVQTRHSPVRALQKLLPFAKQALTSFMSACGIADGVIARLSSGPQSIVEEDALLSEIETSLLRLAPESSVVSPVSSSDLSADLEQLFADVPCLQELFLSAAW